MIGWERRGKHWAEHDSGQYRIAFANVLAGTDEYGEVLLTTRYTLWKRRGSWDNHPGELIGTYDDAETAASQAVQHGQAAA